MSVKPSLSALLRFSAANVRSFRDEASISMEATRLADREAVRTVPWREDGGSVDVLPVAGIFGANASGKTTLLRAMGDMRGLVLGSFRFGDRDSLVPRHVFKLDPAGATRPSHFEVDVIVEGIRWQYGFEVSDHSVLAEWAYRFPRGRQSLMFERDGASMKFGASLRGVGRLLEQVTRHNTLLLSVAGAAPDSSLTALHQWFTTNLRLAEEDNRGIRAARTAELAESGAQRERVLALLQAADLGITDVHRDTADPETLDRMRRAVSILNGIEGEAEGSDLDHFVVEDFVRLTHCGVDGCAELDPSEESLGTLVWLGLIGPVLDALDQGTVLLADELDASLHPNLGQRIISLFQSPMTNRNGAQLLFNAHDTVYLGDSSERPIGRDQIWITEKGVDGASRLYSLADFSPRHDEALGRRYLQGRYGGVPVLDAAGFHRAAIPTPASELADA